MTYMYWNKVESVREATPSGASRAPTVNTALPSMAMDGKAVFTVGALDAPEGVASLTDSTLFQYMYVMNLNTSFTGDDNLYVRIKTGNGQKDKSFSEKTYGTYLSSSNQKLLVRRR